MIQAGKIVFGQHLTFENHNAVVQTAAPPNIGGSPPVDVVEREELELPVLPDEVGQLRSYRAEGCLWAGWVPSERIDPGGVPL